MPDKTSYRASKKEEFSGDNPAIWYQVNCACGEPDCDLRLWLERIGESNTISLSMYQNMVWWPDSLWERVKASLRMLFTGNLRTESDFLIEGEEHIDSFIAALEEGKKYIKKAEEKGNAKT